jgi:hypothetical protein
MLMYIVEADALFSSYSLMRQPIHDAQKQTRKSMKHPADWLRNPFHPRMWLPLEPIEKRQCPLLKS